MRHSIYDLAKQNWLLSLAMVFIVLPCGIYIFSIGENTINIPSWDDYGAILRFMDAYLDADVLEKLKLLFSFHNEHRIAFVRFSSILSYYLTGEVDFQYLAIWGNLGLIGICFIIYKSIADINNRLWFFMPVPYLLFQLQYWELSLWSMASLQTITVLFLSFSSLFLLTQKGKRTFFMAAVLAILSTFCSGNGMFVFLAGFPILVWSNSPNKKLVYLWSIIAVFSILTYFNFGAKTGFLPKPFIFLFEHPLHVLQYFFLFLGSGLVDLFGKDGIYLADKVGLMFCLFTVYLFLFQKGSFKRNILLNSLLIFILLTALSVAMKRGSQFEVEQALSSRYKIHSLLFIALQILIILDILKEKIRGHHLVGLVVLSLIFYWVTYNINFPKMVGVKNRLTKGAISYHLKGSKTQLFYKNQTIAEDLIKNSHNKGFYTIPPLNKIFYPSNLIKEPLPAETNNIRSAFDLKESSELIYIFDGWAFIKDSSTYQNKIYVVMKSEKDHSIYTTTPNRRRDVSAQFKKHSLDESGFSFSISKAAV